MEGDIKNIEKRGSARRSANLKEARIIQDGRQFKGVVEDECDNGLKVISASSRDIPTFIPESRCELKLLNGDRTEKSYHCEVRWVHINKTPTLGYTYRMGMEIIGRP